MLEWYENTDNCHVGERGGCRVAEIRHCAEGEAEGGLGALARFMAGALSPERPLPPLSPAGWYWQATAIRGVWSRPQLAPSRLDAMAACEAAIQSAKT